MFNFANFKQARLRALHRLVNRPAEREIPPTQSGQIGWLNWQTVIISFKKSSYHDYSYARTDEIAIPYGITVDFHTVKFEPATVTLRDRDSTGQLRIELDQIAQVIDKLSKVKNSKNRTQNQYSLESNQLGRDFDQIRAAGRLGRGASLRIISVTKCF